jgi:septum site-determining protein MinD
MERRVVFDFVNVIQGDARLTQALVVDRSNPNLSLLPASQAKDKDALTEEGVEKVYVFFILFVCLFVVCCVSCV